MTDKIDELLVQFDKMERFSMALNDVFKSFGLDKKPEIDDGLKSFLIEFLRQTYQNHTETIGLINKISSFVSVSDYHREIMKRAKIMEKFLDDFGWIFIASGVTNEKEIKQRKDIVANFVLQIKN